MADAVEETLAEGGRLVVEAGTGVGKSFAYLVPALLYVSTKPAPNEKRPGPVLIATRTIALQEQLVERDLPFLVEALELKDLSIALAKGRGNYVCRRRLEAARREGEAAFPEPKHRDELERLAAWAENSDDGSLSDLSFRPSGEVWEAAKAESGNCLHQKCPFFAACAYQRSRRQMTTADIVIANHALVFSDLALREAGVQYLPNYDVLILDEAHEVEDGAAEHFGARVSALGINRQLSRFMPKKRGSGLFGRAEVHSDLYDGLAETRDAVRELFTGVDRWRGQTGEKRLRRALEFPNPLHTPLSMLVAELRDRRDEIENFELAMEWKSRTDRLDESLSAVELIHATMDPDLVYWTEGSGVLDRSVLRAAPIDIAARLKRLLFREVRAVVMTSATLTVQNRFDHFHRRLGLENPTELQLGSPFDFAKQCEIVLYPKMPDPRLPAYETSVNAALRGLVTESGGGAFLLFTSHRALASAHRALHAEFAAEGFLVLRQGGALRTRDILDAFRTRRDCVLFATDTFWQGIDVRGENLRLVALTRLPFAVPDHPLHQARVERIEEEGGDAFRELSLPQAILKLRQGFGRLIRSSEDTGRVAILDPRIVTKRYGRQFLDSLPRCRVTHRDVPPHDAS